MKKKPSSIIALLLCAALLLALAACGGSGKPSEAELPEEETPADTEPENTPAPSLKGVSAAADWNADFVIDLPDGYRYDDGWSCYTNGDGVQIWAVDMDLYEFDHNFEEARAMRGAEGEGKSAGLFRYWSAEAAEFYGPSTHYFVSFEGRYADFYGCHILVSVPEGKDIGLTQTQDILAMLATVRREGETVGAQGTPPAAAEPEPTAEPEPEPTAEPGPTTPFSELHVDFSGALTGRMSTFMNGGRYDAEGDTLVGLAFSSEGDAELVRMDLTRTGDFADVSDYAVLDTAAPFYVSIFNGYVYYLRDGASICRVPLEGGDIDVLVPRACDYLQVREDGLYYCDGGDYRIYRADLDGRNETLILDKEVYFTYVLDSDWLLYQDDADGESLHLFHLSGGEDATVCAEISYTPCIVGADLFAVTGSEGDRHLSRIALNEPEIAYDEAAGQFDIRFAYETGERLLTENVFYSADGWIYAGTESGWRVEDWRSVENEDGEFRLVYRYSGPDYEVHWELDDEGYIDAIFIGCTDGGAQSIGRFD